MKNASKVFTLSLVTIIAVIVMGTIGYFAMKDEIPRAKANVLPIVVQPLKVNNAKIDINDDNVLELMTYATVPLECNADGCRLYINNHIILESVYPPIYGVFENKKLTQLIVTQSIASSSCNTSNCKKFALVSYTYSANDTSLIKHDTELPKDAVLIFTK